MTECGITTSLIPIFPVMNFPQTYERLRVPVDSYEQHDDDYGSEEKVQIEKPVAEEAKETNYRKKLKKGSEKLDPSSYYYSSPQSKPKPEKRNPKNYDDGKGNFYYSHNYNTKSEKPKKNIQKPESDFKKPEPSFKKSGSNSKNFESNYKKPEFSYKKPEADYEEPVTKPKFKKPEFKNFENEKKKQPLHINTKVFKKTSPSHDEYGPDPSGLNIFMNKR